MLVLVAALAMSLGMFGTAGAQGPPPHGHVKLLHAEWTGAGPTTDVTAYRKCVDLAGGNQLPLNAHHSTVHQGRAGQALAQAGHLVIPTADLNPTITGCADLPPSIP